MSWGNVDVEKLRRNRERGEHQDKVGQGGMIILIVGLVSVLYSGIYFYQMSNNLGDYRLGFMIFGVAYAIIAALYFFLGWLYKKAPVGSAMMALMLYVGVQVLLGLLDLSLVARGIIWKALIIMALVQAIRSARELKRSEAGPLGRR